MNNFILTQNYLIVVLCNSCNNDNLFFITFISNLGSIPNTLEIYLFKYLLHKFKIFF